MSILKCNNLGKTFSDGNLSVNVLNDVSLEIDAGAKIAIVGASGSGKSTLLHLLGGLDLPTTGKVWVDGKEMSVLSDAERGMFRNRYLGFVYQFHHLLAEFTALENVSMPLFIRGVSKKQAYQQATDYLSQVGLGERLEHRPSELSGGERQRAAIARALVTQPNCVLADEPTGNLDRKTADKIFELMMALNKDAHTALVMVTHDHELAAKMDKIYKLDDGQLLLA